MRFRIALALLVMMPGLALAAAERSCQRSMMSMPDNYLKLMDRLDELVTIVPPEEDKYIGDEYAAAMKVRSTARMNAVMRRPLFWASRLHSEVSLGRSTAKMLTVDSLPPKNKVTTAAFLPGHLMMIKDAFGELLDHDAARTVDRDDAGHANLQLIEEATDIQQYIDCWADKI